MRSLDIYMYSCITLDSPYKKMLKNDFDRRSHLSSNQNIENVLLCDIDLNFALKVTNLKH